MKSCPHVLRPRSHRRAVRVLSQLAMLFESSRSLTPSSGARISSAPHCRLRTYRRPTKRYASPTPDGKAMHRNHLLDVASLRNTFAALRHGQSMANVAGIIAASPDLALDQYGLSDVGKAQAEQAGADVIEFAQENRTGLLAIVSSDLLRARETAELVADAVRRAGPGLQLYHGKVILDERLRERGFGKWDGGPDVHYRDVWVDDAVNDRHTLRNVESVMSVMDRATRCILDYDQKLSGATILCVAHGDVLQILQTAFMKLPGTKHRSMPHLETATLRPLAFVADGDQ